MGSLLFIGLGSASSAVDSVFGRVGAVVAVDGDYAASQVGNDSGVDGDDVAAALDTLNTDKADAATAIQDGDAAGGDLDGTYPNPSVVAIQTHAVSNAAPNDGDVLTWDGAQWAPAPPGRIPALQPNLYSPLGQWALDKNAAGGIGEDRTGHGYTMNDPPWATGPDLRPAPAKSAYGNTASLVDVGQEPVFRDLTEFTVTCRFWNGSPGTGFMLVGSTNADFGFPNPWEMQISSSNELKYFSGRPSGVQTSCTLAGITTGWQYCSMRRDVSRTLVTLGINSTFGTFSVAAIALTLAASFRMGSSANPPFVAGGLADVCIWPTRLSDAQVLNLYSIAMGI